MHQQTPTPDAPRVLDMDADMASEIVVLKAANERLQAALQVANSERLEAFRRRDQWRDQVELVKVQIALLRRVLKSHMMYEVRGKARFYRSLDPASGGLYVNPDRAIDAYLTDAASREAAKLQAESVPTGC